MHFITQPARHWVAWSRQSLKIGLAMAPPNTITKLDKRSSHYYEYFQPLFPDQSSAQTFLGSLDALFMICYAVALVFWGWLGDRLSPLGVVVFGMVGSAIMVCLQIIIENILNDLFSVDSFWFCPQMAEFLLNSLVHSHLGPLRRCPGLWLAKWSGNHGYFIVDLIVQFIHFEQANWFPHTNRGFIMGLWAACQTVGNIRGEVIISLILPMGYQV